MSSHEFAEWLAFYRIQPFGEWREDFRMAVLASVITNVMTRTKESDPVRSAEDFMPDFEKALDEYLENENGDVSDAKRVWQKVEGIFAPLAKKKAPHPRPSSNDKEQVRHLEKEERPPPFGHLPKIEEHDLGERNRNV